MRHDFTKLLKQEIVNRFETVVQNEIHAHNSAVASYRKKLQDFENRFDEEKKRSEKIISISHETQKNVSEYIERERNSFSDKLNSFGKEVAEKLDETRKNLKLSSKLIEDRASLKDLENLKKSVFDYILDSHESKKKYINKCLSEFHEKLKKIQQQQQDLLENQSKFEEKISNQILDMGEHIRKHSLDYVAFHRILNAYRKSMWIQEKKIEYLDDKINRLNERLEGGVQCPKPD